MLFLGILAQPQVSVIIPLYNHYQHINNSIQSILNQTYENFNIIVVDDASTDDSYLVMKKIAKKEPKITVLQHEENRGPFQARLTALKNTTAEYVLFVDADDYLNNDKILQLAVDAALKHNADCVQFSELLQNIEWTKPYLWGNPPAIGPQRRHFMVQKWAESGVGTALHGKLLSTAVLRETLEFLGEEVTNRNIYYAEDLLVMLAFHQLSSTYVGLKDVGYTYFDRFESSTERSAKTYSGAQRRADDTAFVVEQVMKYGMKKFRAQFKEQIYYIFLNAFKTLDAKMLVSQKSKICETYLNTKIVGNKRSQMIIDEYCKSVKAKYAGMFSQEEV
ncbi:Glycosyl_transferase family 2 protein [Hexamita inflata]|uniref:Glycosyl transferase family 2 protein n=1 Tax=Hexamita inflata TaxID=28002 RepID=A0AA86PZX7_9EUKA|nr:Glycosyl transferase family 2 protein [Hexamita inflata]